MNNLHPYWNATDDVPEENSQAQPTEKHIPIGKTQISRRPAAFVGIALVVAVSVGFIEGVDILRGQLLSETNIRITTAGLDPIRIEVPKNGQIAWTNEDFMPHIMASDTLCGADDECLRTETILQGDTVRYDIPSNITPGTYGYFSTTNDTIVGEIIVVEEEPVEEAEPDPVEPADTPTKGINLHDIPGFDEAIAKIEEEKSKLAKEEETLPPPEVDIISEKPVATNDNTPSLDDSSDPMFDFTPPTDPEPESPAIPSNLPAQLPQNPYTIGAYGGPPPPPFEFTQPGTPLHQSAPPPLSQHTPMNQPQTGAGLWLAFLASFGAIYLFMKRYLRNRQVVTKL